MASGDADIALRAYTTAIELLPLVSWHGLDRATQENILRTWIGLLGSGSRRHRGGAAQPEPSS